MMKFNTFIKNIAWFLLPLLYIIYILYIRLILVRDPRMLYITMSYEQISITIIIIICLLLRIYALLKKENALNENVTDNRLLVWLLTKLSPIAKTINTMWIEFYHQFTRHSLKFNFLILTLVKLLANRLNLIRGLVIISFLEILPKLILVIAFLVDVFVFQQFYYFYKFVFLLLFPLIYVAMRGILLQFYVDNFEALRSFLDITVKQNEQKTVITYTFKDTSENPDYIKDMDDFLYNHYIPVSYIPNIVLHFDSIKRDYKLNWLFLIIVILYLLGWLTILFFGIYV